MGERTFDDFDAYADGYRSIHTQNIKISGADSFYFAKMKVDAIKPFENAASIKLLDVGCGDGATEIFMAQYFPQWIIDGIDISEKSIAAARSRELDHVAFSTYDGAEIPFEENSFDVVFIAGVLHHVNFNYHSTIIKEISRVLKKGGRLYFFEHNPLNPLTRHLVRTCIFDKDAKLLNSGYASRLLAANSFKMEFKKFIIFFPRRGILSRLIFMEKYLQWLPLGGQYFIRAIKK